MLVDGKKIAEGLQKLLKREFIRLRTQKKITPKLVVFLIGNSKQQLSFVKIKHKIAKHLGVLFELVNLPETVSFEELIHQIKSKAQDIKTTGVIIQQPLPPHLQTESIYNFIPEEKEIEGHLEKSLFVSPLGLAILTVIRFIYGDQKIGPDLLIDLNRSGSFFKRVFKNKKTVILGRGITGGKPIGHTLSLAKINYITTHSQTPNPEEYYLNADLVISAVGKRVLLPQHIKLGATLISVGMHYENGDLTGDYDVNQIKNIAGFYTPTPGGIGPLDVIYLFKNLLFSAKFQKTHPTDHHKPRTVRHSQ